MRKIMKRMTAVLGVAVMAFTITACGNTSAPTTGSIVADVADDCVQKVYDALTASDSAYSKMKSLDTYSTYSESLDGDKITMSVKSEDESFNFDDEEWDLNFSRLDTRAGVVF